MVVGVVCGVARKDNSKGVECSNSGNISKVVVVDRLVVVVVSGWSRELGIERTPTHALPQTKSPTL